MSGARGGGGRGAKEIDPSNVSMLSIPKQTKFFVDSMRSQAE